MHREAELMVEPAMEVRDGKQWEHAGDTGASHEQDMSMGPKERKAACRYAAGIRCDTPIPSKFVVTNIKQQKCSGYFVSKNANLHQLHVTKYTYSIAHILPRKIS